MKINNAIINKKRNLKDDIIFKVFFSRKGNEKYLKDFLNSILDIEINNIKVKEEVNLEQLSPKEKGGRLDIQAELNDGLIVNIEMQMRDLGNIELRNDIYEAKSISRDFLRGEKYENARQVISIYILNYNLFGFDEYISDTIKVLEKHRDFQINSITKEYYIELPKFRKLDVDMNIKLNQWLAFIDDYDRGKVEMAKKKNEIIKQAGLEMNYLTGDEAVRRLEELRDKWASDRASEISYETRKARVEQQKEIAEKMLKKGMEIELIKELTGLSLEEIKNPTVS